MTISPPSKVKTSPENEYQVLASGIDTLFLAIDVCWKDETFFNQLEEMKTLAIEFGIDHPIQFPDNALLASIKPYGRKGYKWIVENGDFQITIGNWLKPKSRPSIMVSIRSEALWREGPQEIVEYLKDVLFRAGAESISIKPSRVDVCIDIIFPNDAWKMDLIELRVTRARYAAPHFDNSTMTGISIGKGNIAARLYDKMLEIKQKSKKFWMFDVWDIWDKWDLMAETLKDNKIIRVEGQFRREALKELGIDQIDNLFSHIENLWAYFSQDWLKFQDSPGEHHTMRTTLPWWKIVQNGFLGIQNSRSLIRCKALQPKKKQLFAQTYGTMTSFLACIHEEKEMPIGSKVGINDLLYQFDKYSEETGKSDLEVEIDLMTKRAKTNKTKSKMHRAHIQRKLFGFPSNIKPEFYEGKEDK
jgi:hypothetical protein